MSTSACWGCGSKCPQLFRDLLCPRCVSAAKRALDRERSKLHGAEPVELPFGTGWAMPR